MLMPDPTSHSPIAIGPRLGQVALVGGVVLLALALRMHKLGDASAWWDEMYSHYFASLPWSVLWLSPYDLTPPIFYSVLKLILPLGDSEIILRLPSVVFGVATIPIIYLIGSAAWGRFAGLVAALFLAISAIHIEYSQEARAYGMLVFFLAVASLGLLNLLSAAEKQDKLLGWICLYGVGSLLALYTHNIAVYFIFVAQVLGFSIWWWRLERDRRFLWTWLGANAVVLLFYLPWLKIVIFHLRHDNYSWLTQHTPLEALHVLRAVHGFHHSWFTQPFSDILLFALMSYGLYQVRQRPVTITFVVLVVGVAPLLIWATGIWVPVFLPKTVLWGLIGSSLSVGIALSCMSKKMALALLAVTVILALNSVDNYYDQETAQNQDWRGAVEYYLASDSSTDSGPIVFCKPNNAWPFWYYARHDERRPRMLGWGEERAQLLTPYVVHQSAQSPWALRRTEQVALQLLRPNHPSGPERIWAFQSMNCRSEEFTILENALGDLGWVEQSVTPFKRIKVRLFSPKDY